MPVAKTFDPRAFDPRVDMYITKCKPFAQPILEHLRELVHKAVPDVTETIKWSHAFFEYKGVILANMAGFNEHCSFGLWGKDMAQVLNDAGLLSGEGMGSLGKLTSVKDLPANKQMIAILKLAAKQIDEGKYVSSMARPRVAKEPKTEVEMHPAFAKALKANKAATAVFAKFSPSCKREYLEWVADAKRDETRDKRITQAVEWIAEGKQRNWKYQNC